MVPELGKEADIDGLIMTRWLMKRLRSISSTATLNGLFRTNLIFHQAQPSMGGPR